MMKLYVFVGIFIFEFVTTLLIVYYKKQIFNTNKIAKDSLTTALVAVVAYSIYTDISYSNKMFADDNLTNDTKNNIFIGLIIIFFVSIQYFLEYVFANESPAINDKLNNIYSQHTD